MAKKKDKDRRAIVEEMRRQQKRAEKRRTYAVVAACAVVGLAIIAIPAWQLIQDSRQQSELAGRDLAAIGVPAGQANCTDIRTQEATGSNDHRPEGSEISYNSSPPAFGPHYPATAPFDRKFYTARDRPDLSYLVHNLEHGYNILWYDESVADDDQLLGQVRAIAEKFSGDSLDDKFIAAPWTAEDGPQFPEGMSFALTHWSLGDEDESVETTKGIWKYCGRLSGEVVAQFHEDYPFSDSPEPRAM